MLLHSDIIATCGEYTLELLLWLLGAFILGYLLSWFLGAKYRDRVVELEKDLADWKIKCNDLEVELSSAKYEREKTMEELTACRRARGDAEMKLRAALEQIEQNKDAGGVENLAAAPIVAAAAQNFAAAVPADPDDLKKVEGIGPKIEGLLNAGGINTFSGLASTSVERIQEILTAAGDRYKLANPASWPKQAQMAADGQWDELKVYQDHLQGGKE